MIHWEHLKIKISKQNIKNASIKPTIQKNKMIHDKKIEGSDGFDASSIVAARTSNGLTHFIASDYNGKVGLCCAEY